LTAALLAGAGCGSSPTAPTDPGVGPAPPAPPAPANQAPVIATMTVAESSYRTGRITASASDPDGRIASGTVDWGDGTTSTVSGDYASITLTHRYDSAQAFSVTLRVVDDDALATQQARSVTIRVPPEACIGIEIIEVCAQATSDFRNVRVSAKAGDIVLSQITLTDGQPAITLPLAGGFGRLTLSADLQRGRIVVGGEVCPIPFLVCVPIGSHTIQL
jgi:hypothetical protein